MPPEGASFPAGLFALAGHGAGGVKTPFQAKSGRPTGSVVRTPVVRRIDEWLQALVDSKPATPHAVFLVGGPGNGKSDAVEYFLARFDELAACGGKLVEAAQQQFSGIPPRRVVLDLVAAKPGKPIPGKTTIEIVQDASVAGGDGATTTEAELLVADIHRVTSGSSSVIYLCCANRGITAAALAFASNTKDAAASAILEDIAVAVSVGETARPCWPLQSDSRLAVWPMDVESLLVPVDGNESAIDAILAHALADERWDSECVAGELCPFHTNKRILSSSAHRAALVKIIRFDELAAGRRWTFRDLLSLIAHLLAGQESSYRVAGKRVSPCEWAAERATVANNASNTEHQMRATLELAQRHYALALFSRWPRLRKEYQLFRPVVAASEGTLGLVAGLFAYLARYRPPSGTAVGRAIADELGPLLDPVEAQGDDNIADGITINAIEEATSYSIGQGFELVLPQLEPLERRVVELLVEAEKVLGSDLLKKTDLRKLDALREMLKVFCGRFLKRVLGARAGITRDSAYLQSYLETIQDGERLHETAKLFQRVLNDDTHHFCASLLTTFGQPAPARERDIILRVARLPVRQVRPTANPARPFDPIPRFEVASESIPATYPLYRALLDVDAGLDQAGLPAEVLALLEGVRARLAGVVVHDDERLGDDARVEFGGTGVVITLAYDRTLKRGA